MRDKRTTLLSSFMHIVTIVAVAAAIFMVFHTFFYGPTAGAFSLRGIHYTFRDLHQNGLIFYSLLALAVLSWLLTPSPRTSTRGK